MCFCLSFILPPHPLLILSSSLPPIPFSFSSHPFLPIPFSFSSQTFLPSPSHSLLIPSSPPSSHSLLRPSSPHPPLILSSDLPPPTLLSFSPQTFLPTPLFPPISSLITSTMVSPVALPAEVTAVQEYRPAMEDERDVPAPDTLKGLLVVVELTTIWFGEDHSKYAGAGIPDVKHWSDTPVMSPILLTTRRSLATATGLPAPRTRASSHETSEHKVYVVLPCPIVMAALLEMSVQL